MSLNIAIALPLAGFLFALWLYRKAAVLSRRSLPLPPGPKRLPIIGNALDIPAEQQWKVYAHWAQKHGDVVYLQVFGQPIIVLNTMKAVLDLFEKRSANNSDRPHSEMIPLIGFDWSLGTMRYGQLWRRHRRAFHQFFNQSAVSAYEQRLCRLAPQFLRNLYKEPKGFAQHTEQVVGAQILSILYGIKAAEKDDEFISIMERGMRGVVIAFHSGSFLVDYLPFLKYVPAWMPGASFKKKAAKWKVDCLAMKQLPWQNVVVNGSDVPVAVKLSERLSHLDGEAYAAEEEIAENVAGIAYAAGADTTISTLQCFFQAMILFPEVQKSAQEELTRVVGPYRLPEFSDRAALPYINALCKECLRWQPVVPLGLAHRSIADDEYNGYLIPGGTILYQNTWGILHDPQMYPEPEEFKPERYLKDGKMSADVMDPAMAAFGAGRRICPGRYLSDLSIFINIACVLHTFDIMPALDAGSNKCEPIMMTGVVSHPEPFECSVKPRSRLAESLILSRSAEEE
ncbi:CyP450 monooxygenase [Obba rivulosa]|uniref:CyP450 monooxygenase n=1 Tax=Obba rivulosa TaxID=1052685 RepID=A0A8E2AYK2_9APHY|nr:CyP450 monooxygenase [Obba rivulosa]